MSEPEREKFEKLQEEKRPMDKEFVSSFERRGIKKGQALGEAAGQRTFVFRQLNKKFGELTADQKAIVEALSVEQLEEISLEIFDANSLSELPGFDK